MMASSAVLRGGLKNRRLSSFSFRFLADEADERAVCAQRVCPKEPHADAQKHSGCLHLALEGGGLNAGGLHHFAGERFRVSVFVTYTCKRTVRWPRG